MTYSVLNLKIDNEIQFAPGVTAGYVLSINADGTTGWVEAQGGGEVLPRLFDTKVVRYFAKISATGSFLSTITNQTAQPGDVIFNTDGTLIRGGFDNICLGLDIDENDNVYIGGEYEKFQNEFCFRFCKLANDLTYDTSFNTNNVFTNGVEGVNILGTSSIFVNGYLGVDAVSNTFYIGVRKLNFDGTVDTSFGDYVNFTGFNDWVDGLTFMVGTDKIYTCGRYTEYNGDSTIKISRLNADGTLDNTFVTGAGLAAPYFVSPYGVLAESTGKVYVYGDFDEYDSNSSPRLARINTDGTYDGTFSVGTGFNAFCIGATLDGNKVVCVGRFTDYNGTAASYIVRLNDDGTIDNTFDTGTGFNNECWTVYRNPSGKFYVFTFGNVYNGTVVPYVIRLNNDGTLDTTFNLQNVNLNDVVVGMKEDSNGNLFVSGYFQS
jgi:uncharacterized delta-60 repeat protein